MDYWLISIWVYLSLATATLVPTLIALVAGVRLNPAGISFEQTAAFSEASRTRLAEHYSRLEGTLGFWKNRATSYKRFHYYCVVWTILSAWAVPLLGAITPQFDGSASRWFLVTISSHVALALSFHSGLKVSNGMRAFRLGESEFYDLYRRLFDRPDSFGEGEAAQLDFYFREVERIRRLVRNTETDTIPDVESIGDRTNASGSISSG